MHDAIDPQANVRLRSLLFLRRRAAHHEGEVT
jgi:hypothetical protein